MRGIRSSKGTRPAAAAALLAAARLLSAGDNPPSERTEFGRVEGEITLDGVLDEMDWRTTSPITQFFEIYPANLGTPAVATTAAFLYDDRNVYVAIRALDPNAASSRAPIVRRDQVFDEQDYVEVFLDPLNTRRSAQFFRVNARGIVTDGQYNDQTRLRDYSPDLNFDAATSLDERGWTVEMRIPLSSLRFQTGVEHPWAFIVYRNVPRQQVTTISTAPIPRGETCDLCYASVLDGIEARTRGSLSVIPHISYERLEGNRESSNELGAGIDLTWKPRENTVVDATLFPDFSQIEADAPQLAANAQFALAVTEKRPFFLEGADLLTTQLPVIHTRAFTDPDVGLRITGRSSTHEYTALVLRDAGGGTVVEPGTISSQLALQDFESTALAARNRFLLDDTSLGTLVTARFNDDGSQNIVIGADGTWAPSAADQITAQFLNSQTRKPNRPDLLGAWTGQHVGGNAGGLSWIHSSDAWSTDVTYSSLSADFRAWNGFVTQVGVASLVANAELHFYPESARSITRVGPRLTMVRTDSNAGDRITQSVAPGFAIRAARDTVASLTWYPRIETQTLAGPRSFRTFVLTVSSTPFRWMPQTELTASGGETVDPVTGIVGDGVVVEATIPLRFARFEIASTVGCQTMRSMNSGGARQTLFMEHSTQATATWHFSTGLNLRATHQQVALDASPPFAGLDAPVRTRRKLSSLLLTYQTNWQTRYYFGASWISDSDELSLDRTSSQNQIFAKISYAFSN